MKFRPKLNEFYSIYDGFRNGKINQQTIRSIYLP